MKKQKKAMSSSCYSIVLMDLSCFAASPKLCMSISVIVITVVIFLKQASFTKKLEGGYEK